MVNTATVYYPRANSQFSQHGIKLREGGQEANRVNKDLVLTTENIEEIEDNEEIRDDLELIPIAGKGDDGKGHFIKTNVEGKLEVQRLEDRELSEKMAFELEQIKKQLSILTDEEDQL